MISLLAFVLLNSLHAEGHFVDQFERRAPETTFIFRGTLKTDRGLWEMDDEMKREIGPAPYTCGAFETADSGLHTLAGFYSSVWFTRQADVWRRAREIARDGAPGHHLILDEKGGWWSRMITIDVRGSVSQLRLDQSHTGNRTREVLVLDFHHGEIVRYERRTYPFDSAWEITKRVDHERDLKVKRRDADGRYFWVNYICETDVTN